MLARVPAAIGQLKGLKELNVRYNCLDALYQAAADGGLSKFLAFLRKEEEREEAEARERNRSIGTAAGAWLEFRCKAAVFGAAAPSGAAPPASPGQAAPAGAAGRKGEPQDVDHRPWSCRGHTLCRHSDKFYLFGGVVARSGARTNALYWLSTDNMEWHLVPSGGDPTSAPSARSDHCAVIDPESERMVIFGGRSQVRFHAVIKVTRVFTCLRDL
jgi:hypothetical protein